MTTTATSIADSTTSISFHPPTSSTSATHSSSGLVYSPTATTTAAATIDPNSNNNPSVHYHPSNSIPVETSASSSHSSNNHHHTAMAVHAASSSAASEAAPPPSSSQFVIALAQFGVSSVAMMLGNKAAVGALPLPCTLVVIQAVGTLALLALGQHSVTKVKSETLYTWLPIAFLFTLMLFTSLKSFVYANVSTVIVFRNIGAIITTIAEYFVRGVVVNTKIVLSEVLIVVGAIMYAGGTVDFNWSGFFWILLNICGQVAYGVYLKKAMDTEPLLRDMSKYTMSLYNNLLAIPMVLVVLFLQDEHTRLVEKVQATTTWGWFLIAVTCVFGYMISTSGFGLQKLVSATTFLVINNMTKFLNILLGMAFMNDKLVGLADASGCVLAIGAGCWYSYEQMQLNDKAKQANPKGSH